MHRAELKGLRSDLVALTTMTFVTGLVDAASLLALGGVFVANMTGNVVFLGFSLAREPSVSLYRDLTALAFFLLGATFGGKMTRSASPMSARAFGLVSCLFAISAGAAAVSPHESLLVALLALAMGLRSAAVRSLGIADMTTTVLTLTLTGLAADSSIAGGDNVRVGRRVASLVAMLFGACAGAFLVRYPLSIVLLVATFLEAIATRTLAESLRGRTRAEPS